MTKKKPRPYDPAAKRAQNDAYKNSERGKATWARINAERRERRRLAALERARRLLGLEAAS